MARKRSPAPNRLATAVDGVVEAVAPVYAVKRRKARAMLATDSGYAAAKSDRSRRIYSGLSGAADVHINSSNTLWQLREQCRSNDRNSPVWSGILNRACDNILGPSLDFDPATADDGYNRAAKQYIQYRAAKGRAESRGMLDLAEVLRKSLRSIMNDGDALLVHTDQDDLQLVEADQLATPRDVANTTGRRVINGVEMDRRGRPIRFWIAKRDYGDASYRGWISTRTEATGIPADRAIFLANLKRISQSRGVPVLASSLDLFNQLDDYINSEVLAAYIDSCLAFWTRRDARLIEHEANPGQTLTSDSTGADVIAQKIDRGMIVELGIGEDLGTFSSNRPGVTFEPFLMTLFRMVGAQLGMPLELVLLDFSKTNYSSARAALLEAHRAFRWWQGYVETYLFRPIYTRWIGQAIARGDLPIRDDAFAVIYRRASWEWVDPLKEVQADALAVRNGFRTVSDVLASRGTTRDEYIAGRQSELAAFEAAGITLDSTPGAATGDAPAPTPDDEEDTDE